MGSRRRARPHRTAATTAKHPASILAWSLLVVWAAVALGSVVLAFVSREPGDAAAALWLGYAVVGARVASLHPRNAVGWLLLAFALANSGVTALSAYAAAGTYPGSDALLWSTRWGWYVWLSILPVFLPLAFPDGRLFAGHRRAISVLGIAAFLSCAVGAAFTSTAVAFSDGRRNPYGVHGRWDAMFAHLETLGQALLGVTAVLAAGSLVVRLRRSRGVERQQLKWFAFAGSLPACGWALAITTTLTGRAELVGGILGWGLFILGGVVAVPTATGIAIFRHRLYDIDRIINRSLVYVALTAALAAAYVGSVLVLRPALAPLSGDSNLAVALSTLVIAALFRPARARIQSEVDRRFYRSRYDADRTLHDFGARLRHQLDLDAVTEDLCTAARNTLQPAHISLWMRP